MFMKKQLLTAAILTAAFFTAEAQKPEMAQVLVHYKFAHVRDTTNRANPYTENMVLYIGKSASAYKSYDGILEAVDFKKQLAEQKANSPDGHIQINRKRSGSSTQYYQFPNEQKLFVKDNLVFNSYLIEDVIPTINWKISGDTATFGGLHCQKATTHFKGRDYTAWFCPDIPVHAGPWKLNGLPGVIVDAHDDKNEVVFKFDGVEKAVPTPAGNTVEKPHPDSGEHTFTLGMDDGDTDPNLIELPTKAIKTTQSEFDKLQAAMRKDPQAFADAMMAQQGANMPGSPNMAHIKIKAGPGPVINNPIELPEKK
jgi:GLPGLI family protein